MPDLDTAQRAGEEGRGRRAERPGQIPRPGWGDILWRTRQQMGRDNVSLIAAGVTFYALLALFPMLGALVAIYGLVADPAQIQTQISALEGLVPAEGLDIVANQLSKLAATESEGLSLAFIFGLAVSLWSANKGMKAVVTALNIAYEERESRGFFKFNAVCLLFTFLAIIGFIIALFAVVALPPLLAALFEDQFIKTLVLLIRWPILVVAAMLGIAVLYRYGPDRKRARWCWVSWGSTTAAALWVLASALYSWYIANFGNFNETYGTLGAAIGFLMWIWLSNVIFLMGAELNAEIEHQTATDSTTGRTQPLGHRGARMADTLGPSRDR